jgi:hypothetical protein
MKADLITKLDLTLFFVNIKRNGRARRQNKLPPQYIMNCDIVALEARQNAKAPTKEGRIAYLPHRIIVMHVKVRTMETVIACRTNHWDEAIVAIDSKIAVKTHSIVKSIRRYCLNVKCFIRYNSVCIILEIMIALNKMPTIIQYAK